MLIVNLLLLLFCCLFFFFLFASLLSCYLMVNKDEYCWDIQLIVQFCHLVLKRAIVTLAISGVTGPTVTKIVYNVEKFILFNILKSKLPHCYLFWIPDWLKWECAIFGKIGCHGNVPWGIRKRGQDRSSALKKTLSFRTKIAKIGPADPDINYCLVICNLTTTLKHNGCSLKLLNRSSPKFYTI